MAPPFPILVTCELLEGGPRCRSSPRLSRPGRPHVPSFPKRPPAGTTEQGQGGQVPTSRRSSWASFHPTDTAGAQPRGLLPAPLSMVVPPLRDPQQPLPGARGALLRLPWTADVHPPRGPTDPVPGE